MNARPAMALLAAVACLIGAGLAEARIKLVALPERAATIVRLDNARATLVEEERVLTLHKGLNKVDFSWNGVSIDVDSIRLRVLGHPNDVTLLNVSYPPNEAALVWEIHCKDAVEERVRISYLLSSIDRLIAYKGVADKDERNLALRSFIILRNFSGEDFDNAHVLVDYGEAFDRGILHEETKQLLFFKREAVPITKVWTFDASKLPWDPGDLENRNVGIPVSYRIKNDAASTLGEFALWGGKARVFQDDGHGSTIMLGEDVSPLVPVGEAMELYIGDSRDIVVTQRKMREQAINERKTTGGTTVLYDMDEVIAAKIENFKDTPAVLTMIQHIPGEWRMVDCNLKYTRKDASTLEFEITLPARDKNGPATVELNMHYVRLNLRGAPPNKH
ncbi:MAG: hypothetical protein JW889_02125 [Verrucomicrobia bacterium]|nr:hypothetical protein [Verrucomicrobiota bacterium]